MFEKIYLDPENRCFAEIMSNNRRYVVPPFQRDYSWKTNNGRNCGRILSRCGKARLSTLWAIWFADRGWKELSNHRRPATHNDSFYCYISSIENIAVIGR